MGEIKYIHKDLAGGRWKELSLSEQMGNIGSEIHRALKWREKNPERATRAAERALELFDLTMEDPDEENHPGKLKEVCRAREGFCDYFYGDNELNTDPVRLMKYYDYFAMRRSMK